MTPTRYQKGSLIKSRRADGQEWWILRYRTTGPTGKRVQRQIVIGTTKEFPSESHAQRAADEIRLKINTNSPAVQAVTVGYAAKHFKEVELADDNDSRSWSTKQGYKDMLNGWIIPKWGKTKLMDVDAVAVEKWLKKLKRQDDSKLLSNPSKEKIRNVFSVLFTHAQRYRFAPQGHNPMMLVRQSGKREKLPDILTAEELNLLWTKAKARERAAISIEFGNGLRISEAIALYWSDLDLDNGTAWVVRGFVKGHFGDVKTEASKKQVPLHDYQIKDLRAWREVASYTEDSDLVFGSHLTKGQRPYWPDMILKRHIRPLAEKLGIKKRIGWHTFRRTFASLLKANGEDIKVVQELLRHANVTTTMNLYTQVFSQTARKAQGKIIEMVRETPLQETANGGK